MNTRFTIEEENIVAIYAEDSRETTLENILAAMPYMDEDMRQLAVSHLPRRGGKQAASHDGQRVFRKGVYLDRRGIAHREQGRGCRFPAPRPCSFFVLAWTIRKPFLRV